MATINIWEVDGEVKCKARLTGKKYASTTKVEFAFHKADDDSLVEKIAARIKSHIIGEKTAEAVWKPPRVPDTRLSVRYKYKLLINDVANDYFADDVVAWAKTLEVAVTKEDGAVFPDVLLTFTMDDAPPAKGEGRRAARVNERKTNAQGKVVFDLPYPSGVGVAVKRPFKMGTGGWTVTTGRKRAATVKRGFTAAIESPVGVLTMGQTLHKQWVNLDPSGVDPSAGPTLRVKIRATDEASALPGDLVYAKVTYAAGNSTRKLLPGEKKPGHVENVQGMLTGHKRYGFDVPLGPAGGDKVTIEVGGTPECADDKLEVETWRKLFYAIAAPDFMAANLSDVVLPTGTVKGLPTAATNAVKSILDPTFIEYEVCWSSTVAGYPAYQIVPCAYMSKPTLGRDMLVVTRNVIRTPPPVPFPAGDVRTIKMKLCDQAMAPDLTPVDAAPKVDKQPFFYPFTTTHGAPIFHTSPVDGSDEIDVAGCTWTADITGLDKTAVPLHPAFADADGTPQSGPVDRAWFKRNNTAWLEIKFPDGSLPKRLVVPTDGSTPVAIELTFAAKVLSQGLNGSSNGLFQIMVFKGAAPAAMAATLCHELGHSMGMTITPKLNQPPFGLPAPPHVDSGGDYYRNPRLPKDKVGKGGVRNCHNGSHCASGVDKTLASFAGLPGPCVLFGEGADERPRTDFCATCKKYIKARNVHDISMNFATCAAEDC